LAANANFCHGDVLVDSAGTASLSSGHGFSLPWEEGTTFYPDPLPVGDGDFRHPFDSHGPGWPILGAPLVWVFGTGYRALQALSWMTGVLMIAAVARLARRFVAPQAAERAAEIAAWACALSLPLWDYSGNGSLYSGHALGIVLLPLVAGGLETGGAALAAGALLGFNYLVAYQSALLIPIFAIAVARARGLRGSVRPLAIAAAGCLAVTIPWFIRNALIWGDPLYSTNSIFFASRVGKMSVDLAGLRPEFRVELAESGVWPSLAQWSWTNLTDAVAFLPRLLPIVCLFALGGFQRILTARGATPQSGSSLRFGSTFLAGALLALTATAIVCPELKTRSFIPILPILVAAAAVELGAGARPSWLLAAAALLVACYWLGDAGTFLCLTRDWMIQLPAMALLILGIFWTPLRRWLPGVAIALLTIFGGIRVAAGLNAQWKALVYGEGIADSRTYVATPTFYDSLTDPWTEGVVLARQRETYSAVRRLRLEGCKTLYSDVAAASFWLGNMVTCRGRVEIPHLSEIADFFDADGMLFPTVYFDREPTKSWLVDCKARLAYQGNEFTAYRIPQRHRGWASRPARK
jgi:hypothetical protein